MIVVDTNVLAYLHLPGEHTETVEAVWREDPDWHAPRLWRSEFRNVLAGQVRHRGMAVELAGRVARTAETTMAGREHEVDARHVLRLASASGRSAYDCEFAALAEVLSVDLITSDRDLAEAFPATARTPADFLEAGRP